MEPEVKLTRADEDLIARLGVTREAFVEARRRELAAAVKAKKPVPRDANGLSAEDYELAERLGVSREALVAQANLAAPTLKPAPQGRADMAAPCPNCGHIAAHPCSAASCNCNGMVPSGPTDRLSASDIAIADRLGVSHSELLKARREEAGRN